jgi:DNA primase
LENCLPVLREGRQASFLFLPDGEDPDTLVRKEGGAAFEARLAHATPFSNFLYETLLKKTDGSTLDGRARLVELARPLLSKLPAGVFRHMMVARLAELARMEADSLSRMLARGDAGASKKAAGKPARGTRRQTPAVRMSQVRLAVALLLQQPRLAALAPDPQRFANFQLPGLDLLIGLVRVLQEHPDLSTAALLERWRDTEQGSHLMRLAQWQHPVPEEGLEAEFSRILERIHAEGIEQRQSRLIERSRAGEELTVEEKREWQQLFSSTRPQ